MCKAHTRSQANKKQRVQRCFDWRRDRDLNPGYVSVHSRSKTARSTTLTSLHINFVFGKYLTLFFVGRGRRLASVHGPSSKPIREQSTGLFFHSPSGKRGIGRYPLGIASKVRHVSRALANVHWTLPPTLTSLHIKISISYLYYNNF